MLKRNEEAAIRCAFKRAKYNNGPEYGYKYLDLWAHNNISVNHGKMQAEFEKLWCEHIGVDYNEAIK